MYSNDTVKAIGSNDYLSLINLLTVLLLLL